MFLLIVSLFGFHGVIEQDTTWSDTAYLTGDVWVNTDVTLTINPGTVLLYADSCEWDTAWYADGDEYPKTSWGINLVVEGNLNAQGFISDSIHFMNKNEEPYIARIIMANGWDSLSFCVVKQGSFYISHGRSTFVSSQIPALSGEMSTVVLSGCVVDSFDSYGIHLDRGSIRVDDCVFLNGRGVYSNLIGYFGAVIFGKGLDSCHVNNTTIRNVMGEFFQGVPGTACAGCGFFNCSHVEILSCTFDSIVGGPGGYPGPGTESPGYPGGSGNGVYLKDCQNIQVNGNTFLEIKGGPGGQGSGSYPDGPPGASHHICLRGSDGLIINNEFSARYGCYVYIDSASQPVIGGSPGNGNKFLNIGYPRGFVISNHSSNDIDATYNYWETGLDMIDSLIFDYYDDASKGIVHYDNATDVEEREQANPAVTCQMFNTALSVYFNESLSDPVRLNLYDVAGRNAYSTTFTERQTFHDLSGLSRGIYFVSVRSENNQLLRKRLVLR